MLLEKRREKFVNVMDLSDGSLYVWVIASAVCTVLDIISLQLLSSLLFIVWLLLCTALLFDFLRYHCGESR